LKRCEVECRFFFLLFHFFFPLLNIMRMPIALSPLARRARIPRHPALSVPGLGLINTGWHHGSVTTQARWKSSDQARPSTESFSRKEVAKRRRMEAKEPSGGDTGHGPHPLDSSRDVRKEALDAKKDEKVFRPARLPIVLCHGTSKKSLVCVCRDKD